MIDYFQYHIPLLSDKKAKPYENHYGISYKGSNIDFTEQALALKTQNNLHIQSQIFTAEAEDIRIESIAGDIKVNTTDVLNLISEVLSCGPQLKIDNTGITITAKQIVFLANNVKTSSNISCEGDYHICPQQDGPGNPHLGGVIQTASPNVFINNKGVARDGDFAPCKTTPNQIVSHMHAITVNGKSVAHQFANTQHQGKISSGSASVTLTPTYANAKDANSSTLPKINELHISLIFSTSNKQKTVMYMQCNDLTANLTISHEIGVISGLSQQDLTNIIQLNII